MSLAMDTLTMRMPAGLRSTALSVLVKMRRAISRSLHTLGDAFEMWSQRLQPSYRPPLARTESRRIREELLALDERELRSEQFEVEFREKMPTLSGEFIPDSAPIIDDK